MKIDDKYTKASRYNIRANKHNFQVFHRRLLIRPWQGLFLALLMSALAANGFFNLIDSPQWNRHPLQGWIIGAIAVLPACYFFFVLGLVFWQDKSPENEK